TGVRLVEGLHRRRRRCRPATPDPPSRRTPDSGGTKGSYRPLPVVRETRPIPGSKLEVSAHVREIMIRRNAGRKRRGGAGQSLVEFSLILVLLGIIQFGFIFNTYVTMTNAARDAARMGTIYVYDRTSGQTKATNDLLRNESVRTEVLASMNMLGKTSPYFSTTGTWTQSGDTFTNGDLRITYVLPSGVTNSETRMGQQI